MASNFNKHIDQPFGWEPNEIIFNPNLSLKAKGLWLYMNAKPDGWFFAAERIAKESNDGVSSVRSALKELASCGLLKWKKQSDGRVIYTLESHCIPQSFPQEANPELENHILGNDPKLEKPKMGKTQNGKTLVINNKEENKERIIKKIDEASALANKKPSRASMTDEEYEKAFYERNTIRL